MMRHASSSNRALFAVGATMLSSLMTGCGAGQEYKEDTVASLLANQNRSEVKAVTINKVHTSDHTTFKQGDLIGAFAGEPKFVSDPYYVCVLTQDGRSITAISNAVLPESIAEVKGVWGEPTQWYSDYPGSSTMALKVDSYR